MAVAVVRSYEGTVNDTTLTIASVDSSGGDCLLLLLGWYANDTQDPGVPTWDGNNATIIGSELGIDTGVGLVAYRFLAPSGTHSVVFTISAGTPMYAIVVVLSGVHQTVPIGTTQNSFDNTESLTATSTTAVSSATGDRVVDFFIARDDDAGNIATMLLTLAGTGGATLNQSGADGLGILAGASSHLDGAASVTMGYTWSTPAMHWFRHLVIPVAAAAGGAAAAPRVSRMTTLGVS